MAARGMIVASALLLMASPALAQDDDGAPTRVPLIQQLYDCRAIADPTARLACFDRQVSAMESAETARDIRIVDREGVQETRRGLFGFSLGRINLFGGDDEEEEEEQNEIREVQSAISRAARTSTGNWSFTLENGQRWIQTDSQYIGRDPVGGEMLRIRRGALGSYVANIDNRPGIRVRREQ